MGQVVTDSSGRHLPGCMYQNLQTEQTKLFQIKTKTREQNLRCFEIAAELGRLPQKLINGECPKCGINQTTGRKNRERRASFAR